MKKWFIEFQMSSPETKRTTEDKMDYFFSRDCKKKGFLVRKREERKNENHRRNNLYGRD